jgi:exonuclease III
MSSVYSQGSIDLFFKAGSVDAGPLNPHSYRFSGPASTPVGRVDLILTSPELAERLSTCNIVTEGVYGPEASEHLPVYAEFAGTVS